MIKVKVTKLNSQALIPSYMSSGAAGCDIHACIDSKILVKPGERLAIPTGLSVEIPPGYEIQVRPRSGLAFKKGLTVINAPGTIDSDYRGEIKVLVVNLGSEGVDVSPNDRIAQMVLQQVSQIEWLEVENLSSTERGVGGFGSTGVTAPN